jgi:peptidoglycan hydrolase-like protein with peptidoglycan-binding domain
MKRLGFLAGFTLVSTTALAQPVPSLTYVQPLSQPALQSVQQRLHDIGVYGGNADGVWGRDSQSALVRLQQNKGLQVTGHLNQGTLATLGLNPGELLGLPATVVSVAMPVVTPIVPSNAVVPLGADTIRLVQGRLQQFGYVTTPADGVWGPSTQAGIERLQQVRGLPVTGQLNAPTITAMGLDPGTLMQAH